MKALAGAVSRFFATTLSHLTCLQEPDKAVDYTAQTLKELDKVQAKAILLNDMLNNAAQGEKIGIEGDVYEQVAGACRGARPRIQKWIEDDNGEREGMMGKVAKAHTLSLC